MCLAIGPLCHTEKSALGRLWWRIASQPHRLFLFSAATHAVIFALLVLSQLVSLDQHIIFSSILILHGVIGFSLLGFLISRFPLWFKTSAISYIRYGASYNFAFIGLLFIEVGLIFSIIWSVVGSVLLMASWLIAVKAIHWSYFWGLGSTHGVSKALMWLLYFNCLSLAAGLIVVILDVTLISANMILLAGFAGIFFLGVASLMLFVRQSTVA